MSIQSEIDRLKGNVADSYAAVEGKGGTVPDTKTSDNLAAAIGSIPAGAQYSPGDGITIEDDTISVTTPVQGVLTQEEFDALPEEQKNKGLYVIPGEGGGGGGSSGGAGGVPKGTIVIWSGTAENIPDGWALCDGQDGRPDLRGRFVFGADDVHKVGETGGSEEVALTIEQMPSHNHKYYAMFQSAKRITYAAPGDTAAPYYTSDNTHTAGSSKPHPNMPPFYTLCYIIKTTD